MITPRTTRLVRARSLAGYQRAIAASACTGGLGLVRTTAVIVPTRSAAGLLRRTLEELAFAGGSQVLVLPDLVTRADLYDVLRIGMAGTAAWLTPFDREVMLLAAAHEAITEGAVPPFALRPALVREMLALYDQLRRQQQQIDDFERLLVEELESRAPFDRGAERMLRQTVFLVTAFRSYERRVHESGALDEHGLRQLLLEDPAPPVHRRIVVTVADRPMEAGGLWPADFDLLARVHGIAALDVIATEAGLAAGWHERVHALLPGIEEIRFDDGEPPALEVRTLHVPPDGEASHFTYRDREDEVAEAVRHIKARRRAAPLDSRLDRTAIVFARPLPYVYLARSTFGSAGVPFQCDDALPLAAEPFAAAVDLVLAFATTAASRAATVAMLRSPHLALGADGAHVAADATRALDQALARARYSGDPVRLRRFADEWATESAGTSDTRVAAVRRRALPALGAALTVLDELAPLVTGAPATDLVRALRTFLTRRSVTPVGDDLLAERQLRARTAILALLDGTEQALAQYGDLQWTGDDLAVSVRRWMESQTFTPRSGTSGVHLVDATAARYGRFDEVHLVGLVEGEWPERPRRNLFYSPFLLGGLGWKDDRVRSDAARAAFADLLRLADRCTRVSTFLLEEDSLVQPSPLLDDVAAAGLRPERAPADRVPIFASEALLAPPVPPGLFGPLATGWLALRQARTPATSGRFHGTALPHRPRLHSVGSLEQYGECPFKYFARHVLRLEEEIEDDEGLSARDRGIFVHEVFQRFFERWERSGRGTVTPATIADAQALLEAVLDEMLPRLAEADAALERTRILGSPVAPGVADVVFQMEATRPVAVAARRLEDRFEGVFELDGSGGPRPVAIRGIVDRIDLLADGMLRVIDYKSSMPTRPVQLAVYAMTAVERLRHLQGREYRLGEAAYLLVGTHRGVKLLARRPSDLPQALADAQARVVAAVDDIERGAFPPRPALLRLCTSCAFAAVCRKDHVTESEEPAAAPPAV